jgi:DNA-binding NtrC family response regulator
MKSTTSHQVPPVDEVTVLVVDDEEAFHDLLADAILAGHGYHVLHAYSGGQCVELLAQHRVDVVVLDLNLPDGNGFRVLEDMREERDRAVPIVVSAYADPKSIQRAHDAGAWMVLDKRFEDYRWLPRYITQAIEQRKRQAQRKARRRAQSGAGNTGKHEVMEPGQRLVRAAELDIFDRLERSASLPMRSLLRQLRSAAEQPAPVFIQGEPGSDRELLARYLHACSKRSHAPFVAAVAIPGRGLASALGPASPESLLATAAKGTLFIDQIHQLDPEWQHLLLEVLTEAGHAPGATPEEAGPVAGGARIVAGSSTPFGDGAVWGALNTRIHESLSGLQLVIPPLRERLTDLTNELEFLFEHIAATLGVEAPRANNALITALSRYSFPGNEQELRAMAVLACVRKPGALLGPRDMLPVDAVSPKES